MSILITGAAGFIGSNLVKTFLQQNKRVIGVDNLSRGKLSNLAFVKDYDDFHFDQLDICNYQEFIKFINAHHILDPVEEVWHMAANSDIPAGIIDAELDLKDTFITTFNTLQLMKELNIPIIVFASSSAIYGDHGEGKLTEVIGPLFPISNYGAMKLASEAAISASVEGHLNQAFIFRFPNVIGVPATHGVILDFINKLKKSPDYLEVLGDGTQQKTYLHVEELIDAMFYIRNYCSDRINYFNIGANDDGVTVKFIAEEVVKIVSPNAKINFGLGNRGWVGDVPKFNYSIDKLLSIGWKPILDSKDSVKKAILQIFNEFK
uniref:NAD-dependent epimerase/dehydratase family protein n=1 Tax=Algoriphagus sp. TaxID=1872435 RepID=UPI004047E0DE